MSSLHQGTSNNRDFLNMVPNFLVDYETVKQRITEIKPAAYARSRNHLSGAVTYLGPFMTHGVINTSTVANSVLETYTSKTAEKLLTELAWREYFHRVWQANGDGIFSDLKQPQELVTSDQLPAAIANANTGIDTINASLTALTKTGYMHNHARMWLAATCCNIGRTHWYEPARWLYYHLLDGDLASNSLSWQWVAGSFSHRKYIANQDNLNRYSQSQQRGTFLDMDYEELANCDVPTALKQRVNIDLTNDFPQSTTDPVYSSSVPVLLYSIWNLDPEWQRGTRATRILWIDPAMHQEFALSPLRWTFIKHWANAIDGLGIFVGDQSALFPNGVEHLQLVTREYPATTHWPGKRDEREWCYEAPTGPIRSFSNYWKRARQSSNMF